VKNIKSILILFVVENPLYQNSIYPMLTPFYLEVRQTGNKKNGQRWSDGTSQHGEISGGFAPVCYDNRECEITGKTIRVQRLFIWTVHQKTVPRTARTAPEAGTTDEKD